MQVIYDGKTDTLTIILSDTPGVESDEEQEGVILDYDATGNLVSLGCWTPRAASGSQPRSSTG